MKTRLQWREAVNALPVFDTHTHMNDPGVPIAAQDVWDILHYFWFQQELWSVGYPKNPLALPEDQRVQRFVTALEQVRNTTWALIVREVMQRLYGIELKDAASIYAADEAIRASSVNPDWPQQIIDRLNIKRITVNHEECADFPGLPGVGAAVPLWKDMATWIQKILEANDPQGEAAAAESAVSTYVAEMATRGCRGMRVDIPMFSEGPQEVIERAIGWDDNLKPDGSSQVDAQAFLTHAQLRALSEHEMFAQFFLGISRLPEAGTSMAINNPQRIINLYPLFTRYTCGFELVSGAPQNNLDIAQAARIYPNVHCGGLWWYNFRSSTYRQVMQARLEAVPAGKSVILASDGRCIEWCYAKTLLVKWLLADFLHEQVAGGWIDETDALWLAREWLHDAAERRYT